MEQVVKTNTLIAKFMGYETIPYNGNKNDLRFSSFFY